MRRLFPEVRVRLTLFPRLFWTSCEVCDHHVRYERVWVFYVPWFGSIPLRGYVCRTCAPTRSAAIDHAKAFQWGSRNDK